MAGDNEKGRKAAGDAPGPCDRKLFRVKWMLAYKWQSIKRAISSDFLPQPLFVNELVSEFYRETSLFIKKKHLIFYKVRCKKWSRWNF